jgi:hypothetical protein
MTEQGKARSNSSLFERACAHAGLPKGSLVSPALAKVIQAQNHTLALHNAERDREQKSTASSKTPIHTPSRQV